MKDVFQYDRVAEGGGLRMVRRPVVDGRIGAPSPMCDHEHATREEARNCPDVVAALAPLFPPGTNGDKTPLTSAELATIRERCEAAAPGPWAVHYDGKPLFGCWTIRNDPPDWNGQGYQALASIPFAEHLRGLPPFLAAARLDVSRLLDTIDAVKAPAGFLADVLAERARQDAKWGGPEHDDDHGPGDWGDFMAFQVGPLAEEIVTIAADGAAPSDYRARLVNIAALAMAAAESFDRLSVARA